MLREAVRHHGAMSADIIFRWGVLSWRSMVLCFGEAFKRYSAPFAEPSVL